MNPTRMESSPSSDFAASYVLEFSFLLFHASCFTHFSQTSRHFVLTLHLSISSGGHVGFRFRALQAGLLWAVLLLRPGRHAHERFPVCAQPLSLGHRAWPVHPQPCLGGSHALRSWHPDDRPPRVCTRLWPHHCTVTGTTDSIHQLCPYFSTYFSIWCACVGKVLFCISLVTNERIYVMCLLAILVLSC